LIGGGSCVVHLKFHSKFFAGPGVPDIPRAQDFSCARDEAC
jgi:hypothetical protein